MEDSDAGRFKAWQAFIGQDLDDDIRAMPVLPYPGGGAERMLLQAVRHLRAMRGVLESQSNYRLARADGTIEKDISDGVYGVGCR